MIAAHIENGEVSIREVRKPRPRGHALIRLTTAGICNTDLELKAGYYGFRGIPGHEFVGVVESGPEEWLGKRVVGEINLACGKCSWCQRGLGRHCPRRTVLGIVKHPGAFAEYLTLPSENLLAVPKNLSDEVAVFVEPIAAACEILEQLRIPKGGEAAVLGDGKLGLLIGQVLLANGINVHQFGRHRDKLKIVKRRGAIIGGKVPIAQFDYVIDATGSPEGLMTAVSMCRPRGTVIMKSTVHGKVAIDMAAVIVPEITLLGSRCGRFAPALKLLKEGRIDVEQMVHGCHPLHDAPAAFSHAVEKGTLKILLTNP
ncbi:MAG: alcohol dehydrogenase catalytic domain-containing protein [Acidobacteria bacterium]|nr:alcohol dehydrogenase catalytic domain-containing protein [Acidobacteriota bacterium]